jgi:hypothetical protein
MKDVLLDINKILVNKFNMYYTQDESICTQKVQEITDFSYNPQDSSLIIGKPTAEIAKNISYIVSIYKMNNKKLSMSFYQTWKDVISLDRQELYLDQIFHYLTSRKNNLSGYTYIPNDNFGKGKDEPENIPTTVITLVNKETVFCTINDFINSGIALDQDTLNDLFKVLKLLGFSFDVEYANKEANILRHDINGTVPFKCEDFLRFVIFKCTGKSLLIKSKEVCSDILYSTDYLSVYKELYGYDGLVELSKSFNRFKPLFLSLKSVNKGIVNKVSKLSKIHHVPLYKNTMNYLTSMFVKTSDLKNATTWAILKGLNHIHMSREFYDYNMYRIRNGKMWIKPRETNFNPKYGAINYNVLLSELMQRVLHVKNKVVYIPENIDYALPTSEKSFIGNIPMLTKVYSKDSINVGCYWENAWGACDIDISSLDVNNLKIGWNSDYYDENGSIIYSGDLTDATNGAVEFLKFSNKCNDQLVYLNVYHGNDNSGYNIVVGNGDVVFDHDTNQMMKAEHIIVQANKTTRNRESILGLVHNKNDMCEFTFTEFDSGIGSVSGGKNAPMTISAIKSQSNNRLSLSTVLEKLGYIVHRDPNKDCDIDLSPNNLTKTSFLELFQ